MIHVYYLNPSNPDYVDLIADRIGYAITAVHGRVQECNDLREKPCILLLSGEAGRLDFEELARFKKRHPSIPLIIIDNRYKAQVAIWALRAKIWDYIIVPTEMEYLTASLRHLIDVLGSQRERCIISAEGYRDDRTETAYSLRTDAAVRYIENHFHEPIRTQSLADMCYMSMSTFMRYFKKEQGYSVSEFIKRLRINKAKSLLLFSHKPVKQVALEVGFNDVSYFTRIFKETTTLNPSSFRDQHQSQNRSAAMESA